MIFRRARRAAALFAAAFWYGSGTPEYRKKAKSIGQRFRKRGLPRVKRQPPPIPVVKPPKVDPYETPKGLSE